MLGAFVPNPVFQATDSSGELLNGGLLYSYIAGTNTPKSLYSDAEMLTVRDNPVTLNARGEPEGGSGLFGTGLYKLKLTDSNGVQIWTIDYLNLAGQSSIVQSILNATTTIEILVILGIDNHKHNTDRVPAESPNGTRVNFSTQKKYSTNSLDVYVNGILQTRNKHYSEDGDKLGYTFIPQVTTTKTIPAPQSDWKIEHRYRYYESEQ